MNHVNEVKGYRSVYRYLKIGSKEYAVLDADIALERADDHFSRALQLLNEKKTEANDEEVNKELVLATDFGSKDAPYLLALRILDSNVIIPYSKDDATVFLKIAAERGHPEAAFRMGCAYAGFSKFLELDDSGKAYFASFSHSDRERLGIFYLNRAIEHGHQSAAEELIIAYAYGRGFIQKNAGAFIECCERLAMQNNQAVMIGYGAWLSGMTVNGKDPLPGAVEISQNHGKALTLLIKASSGKNLQHAQHALHLICMGIKRGVWGKPLDFLRNKLLQDVKKGNQLLALYLAWYSIPLSHRLLMPKVLGHYQLTELGKLVDINEDHAIGFLDVAFFGKDEDIALVAKEVLSQVFGRCYLNADGMLEWDRGKVSPIMDSQEELLFS